MQISLVSHGAFHTIPKNPPKIFLLLSALFLGGVVFFSPQVIGKLGIFDSLTDPNPMISGSAYVELLFFQFLSLIVAMTFASSYCLWGRVRSSKLVTTVMSMNSLTERESQELWRFNLNIFFVYFAILILATLYLKWGTKILPSNIVAMINQEDGIIEWGSALLFLVSGFISYSIFSQMRRKEKSRLLYLAIAVLFTLCFMEEISWGQRLFGLRSPEISSRFNVQNETNLHNLGGYFFDHLFILGVFLYGYVLAVLYRLHLFFYNLFNYLKIPIASLGLALGFLLVSTYHDWTVAYFINEKWKVVPEIREFLTASLFVILMLETKKRFSQSSNCQ